MYKQQLLDCLVDLKENGPHSPELGICNQVELRMSIREVEDELNRLFKAWPKFSGNLAYPVPHPDKTPDTAYVETVNVWDINTKYGRNRHDLLDFMIKTLKEELSNGK